MYGMGVKIEKKYKKCMQKKERQDLPGVRRRRFWGTWNCIVLGGLIPSNPPSSSLSLSHILAIFGTPTPLPVCLSSSFPFPLLVMTSGCVFPPSNPVSRCLRAGVKMLTPGTRGRRRGESKISACRVGAGAGGLESKSSRFCVRVCV